jgi:hypothetical protein
VNEPAGLGEPDAEHRELRAAPAGAAGLAAGSPAAPEALAAREAGAPAPESLVAADVPSADTGAPAAPHGTVAPAAEPLPSTGDPRVDDALSRLAEVEALPLVEQVEVYTDIHRRLAAVLADPESRG